MNAIVEEDKGQGEKKKLLRDVTQASSSQTKKKDNHLYEQK